MWRDEKEELQRLEAELLAEDDLPEEDLPEEELSEENTFADTLLEDTHIADSGVYLNYSNRYGKGLRNYASGYNAYNSDRTDEDLDAYSEAVRNPPKRNTGLVILAVVLTLGIVGMLIVYLLLFWGVL